MLFRSPKIIAVITKAFSEVQLRWSAMERELYALWHGVVGHVKLIKGFRCFCYIDHKNNLFSEAQLDNRRRSKKMSNWALELQGFDIVRVWIRGEANILVDAPSRAPWDNELARNMPIPDMPVRELVNMMYKAPEELELLVTLRKDVLLGEGSEWKPIGGDTDDVEVYEFVDRGLMVEKEIRGPAAAEGYRTPTFGTEEAAYLCAMLGKGAVLWDSGDERWPKYPVWVCQESGPERCLAGGEEIGRAHV